MHTMFPYWKLSKFLKLKIKGEMDLHMLPIFNVYDVLYIVCLSD